MRHWIAMAACAAAFAAPTASCAEAQSIRRDAAARDFAVWARLLEELEVSALQDSLSDTHRPTATLISNATVIDVEAGAALAHMDVLIADGRITAVGPTGEVAAPDGAARIDAGGLYLSPGLADMHVHGLETSAQALLNIAHGVPTVRDMDGFAWMLSQREQAARDELFAPSMFVTGQILNAMPMDWYARVVTTEDEARQAVREQAAAGYDAIKAHNVMALEILAAIVDEARAHDLDVVGHIPHDITVAEAIGAGMRTAEHFKGYILDSTLSLSDEDWAGATRGAEIWNTPTIYAANASLYGAAAARALAAPETRLVSPIELEAWREQAGAEPTPLLELRAGARAHMEHIFRTLHADGARLLAGTDSGGGYPFMIYGRALIEEVLTFQSLGMSPAEALATATREPALALRQEGEFGAVVPAARADLVLLRANPLDDAAALLEVEGVCLRGACLDRAELDAMIEALTTIYAHSEARLEAGEIAAAEIDAWLAGAADLRADGFVFRDNHLAMAAASLERLGRADDAALVRGWMADPAFRF